MITVKNMKMNTQIKYKIYKSFMIAGKNAGCHQRAERSFFYHKHQFPVCARCTGVLIGYAVGIWLSFIFPITYRFCVLCCVIMFFDWTLQRLHLKESTNFRRLITGIFGGIGLVGIQVLFFKGLFDFLS